MMLQSQTRTHIVGEGEWNRSASWPGPHGQYEVEPGSGATRPPPRHWLERKIPFLPQEHFLYILPHVIFLIFI